MKNWRLWFGVTGVGILLGVALFGSELAPYPENYNKMIQFFQTSHGKVMRSPPFPPSSTHWFGTNLLGRDILSLLLYGAKYTIFTSISVAMIRVAIGSFTGFWSGIYLKDRKSVIRFSVFWEACLLF